MALFHRIIFRLRGISLIWKLLIPFLGFAFTGTTVLAYIGLTSQQQLIKAEEKKEILQHYGHFMDCLEQKKRQALSLAVLIAENRQVRHFLAERNRTALYTHLEKTYLRMKKDHLVTQFHFHVPPAKSFLRMHFPDRYGEDMESYRRTILDALDKGAPVVGLETGVMGLGIRGVAPVTHDGKMTGTVEIGLAFDQKFLSELHRRWRVDLALYELKGPGVYRSMAKAGNMVQEFVASPYLFEEAPKKPTVLIAPDIYPNLSILLGPVHDYSGRAVALVEIVKDRSEIQDRLSQTQRLMVSVGLSGIAVSFLLTFLVAFLFIKPIKGIVKQAQDIAQEKRERHLKPRPLDEIGDLTRALNRMLDSLQRRRKEIEDHAKNLKIRVQQRTADLVVSMENYRTLVENVPLIVYRVLPDGTTEFINSYLTERLGYTIEEAVGNKNFWGEKILGNDDRAKEVLFRTCFGEGKAYRIERTVRDKAGHRLTFIDHAIPSVGENGTVQWIDGIMMDISEMKKLQERALRSEEVTILGEISARMAHEIRNPLVTAGGFARRLYVSLDEDDPNYKLAQIIVEEVARLEAFLKVLLSSIRPFELSLGPVDINQIIRSWIEALWDLFKAKRITPETELAPGLPEIQADQDRLSQALESLIKHAVILTEEGGGFFVSTEQSDDHIAVTFRHTVKRLSEDDLAQFFYPRVEEEKEWSVLDLPLSKITIHRHGGKIDVFQDESNQLTLRIEMPVFVGSEKNG